MAVLIQPSSWVWQHCFAQWPAERFSGNDPPEAPPSDPSSTDRPVAARAAEIEAAARAELADKASGNPADGYFRQTDDSAGTYFSAAA